MNKSVEELCREISSLTFSTESEIGDVNDYQDLKTINSIKSKKSKHTRTLSACTAPAITRPVVQQFNSRKNSGKFSIPLTITTARVIEESFIKEKVHKEMVKLDKVKNQKATLKGKDLIDKL